MICYIKAPLPPAVADGLLLNSLAAAIESPAVDQRRLRVRAAQAEGVSGGAGLVSVADILIASPGGARKAAKVVTATARARRRRRRISDLCRGCGQTQAACACASAMGRRRYAARKVSQECGHVFAPAWGATLGRGAAARVAANHHRLFVPVAIQKGTRVLIFLWDSLMYGRVPGTRPNISESHSEISTRVPFRIAGSQHQGGRGRTGHTGCGTRLASRCCANVS